jgi:hypothetical protein
MAFEILLKLDRFVAPEVGAIDTIVEPLKDVAAKFEVVSDTLKGGQYSGITDRWIVIATICKPRSACTIKQRILPNRSLASHLLIQARRAQRKCAKGCFYDLWSIQ